MARAQGRRWGRLLPLVILAIEVVAWSLGHISVGTGAALLLGVEAVAVCIAVTFAMKRSSRTAGTGLDRLEYALAELMPTTAARLVTTELRLFGAASQALVGKTDTEGPDDAVISYGKAGRPVLALLAGVCLVELIVVHALVPWHLLGAYAWVRWMVLGISAYAVLWVTCWMLAERARPHLVTHDSLVLRRGPVTVARVPLADITEVTVRERFDGPDEPDHFSLAGPLQPTAVDIEVIRPVPVPRLFGAVRTYAAISFAADDPRRAVAALTDHQGVKQP